MARKTPAKKVPTRSRSQKPKRAPKLTAKVPNRSSVKPTAKSTKKSTAERLSQAALSHAKEPTEFRKGPASSKPAVRLTTPRLLSGGNPQIKKEVGNTPVQAYIAAMPGWKREVGQRLDGLIEQKIPDVRKAVKWNSPFYGSPDQQVGWFLAFHCLTKYVKVAFFRGSSLSPLPPGESKQRDVRYLNIYEGDWEHRIDESQLASWVRQAAAKPGVEM